MDRKSTRRLILSQPRPPPSALTNEDEDADGDDEGDGGDGKEERGVEGMKSHHFLVPHDSFICRGIVARTFPPFFSFFLRDMTLARSCFY